MRILIVSQYFWPENFRINEIAAELVVRGHLVDVLTSQPNYPDGATFPGYRAWASGRSIHDGVMVHRVPVVPRGRGSALHLVVNYLSFILSALLLGPWHTRKRSYDSIFVYAPSPLLQALPALLVGRIKRAPVTVWVQDLWPESIEATGHMRTPWLLALVRAVVRFIYARCDLVLVQSQAFVEPVRALAGRTEVKYLPNPAERLFERAAETEPDATDGGTFTAVYAGNVGAAQGTEVLIEAANLLRGDPRIRIRVIGSGSRSRWLGDEIVRRNLTNVAQLGRRPIDEMPALLRGADALLVTLQDHPVLRLTVPSRVQAYLAVGKPIIASIGGECARVVREAGAGLVTEPGDAAGLATAIRTLAAMPTAMRLEYGARGKAYYMEHFSMGVVIRSLEQSIARTRPGRQA